MKRIHSSLRLLALVAAAPLAASCSSLGEGVPGAVPARALEASADHANTSSSTAARSADAQRGDTEPTTARSPKDEAVAVEAAAPAQVAARGRARTRGARDERVLRLWQDPEFQRRLQLAYVPLTEVEPSATALEQEDLAEIVGLITEGDAGLEEARLLIERMRTDASSAVVHYWYGMISLQQEDFDAAKEGFAKAVEAYPRFLRAWNSLGLVQAQTNDFAGAVESFAEVLSLGPASADTYGFLGIALSSTGDQIGAESAFRMASMLAPNKFEWKVGLAQALGAQARFPDAIAQFDALIQQRPDDPQLWLGQAQAFVKSGQFAKAAENLEFADLLGGSSVETLRLLGDIYTQEQLYDAAADAYVRAIDLAPDQSVAIGLEAAKGLTSRNASDAALAIVEHLESIGSEPLEGEDGLEVLRVRATIARAQQDTEAERAVLEEIEAADPLDGWAIVQLGELYAREGQYEEARYRFEIASEMEGYAAEAQLALGRMLVKEGRFADALVALKRSFREEPRDDLANFIDQVERASKAAR